jgi:Cu2+-exporting ATPase
VLVASATLLAWGASTFETLRGGVQVWFDAAVMFVFLLLAARMIEQRALHVARARVDALARATPALADRELDATRTEAVPVAQLVSGDIVQVAAGANVPADARLLDAAVSFDESLLSGESRPVLHMAGESVLAGSVPVDQPVRLMVTATGTATRLSSLLRLVQRAQEHRPRVARVADKVASWFVLALALVVVTVYSYWHATEPSRAFEVALAMLVISCPCALALAVPTALAAAHSRLSQLGILVCRPDALATLAQVDTVVFDKTGTLADCQWQIVSTQTFAGVDAAEALHLAAALERGMHHPLASAFRLHDDARMVAQVRLISGQGVEACFAGRKLLLGTGPLAAERPDDGALWLGDGATPLARFELRELPRADAAPALQRLSESGLQLHLFSGDASSAVERFVAALGIPLASSAGRLSPDDKLARVRALQAQGACVAMVGDGINDAPVLAGADVSIAVAGGTALAQHSADLVLLHPSLLRIADARHIARRTRRICHQNFAWAIGYNLVALPLAALGLVRPWAAVLAMVASSLTVTLNALRLTSADSP